MGVAVYSEPENKNVNEIADHALAEAKAKGNGRSYHRYCRSFGR